MRSNFIRVLVGCFVLSLNAGALAAPHKVRVSDPVAAKILAAQGARVIADYGAFQLLEADDTVLTSVSAGQAPPVDEMNVIELNARPLDTRTPQMQALRQAAGTFAGKRLHLVHFAGPIKPEWVDALEQNGMRVVTYIPQNAYLVYGDAPALARMKSWARTAQPVQWEGDYAADYKIHPRARLVDEKGLAQNPGTDVFAVQLVDDAEANSATLALIDQLKLAPIRKQFRVLQYLNVIVRLPADRLDEIAARPEVVSIHPYYEPRKLDERQDQIVAGNVSGGSPTGPGYLAWLAGKGFTQEQFTASGFAVDVSDSGIDNGTTTPGHFGLYQLGDPSLTSRVVYNRLEGSPNGGSTKQGCDGHGTLNTHIIAGFNDLAAVSPHADSSGFRYGLGVCPFVKVGSSVIFDPDNFTSPDYENLQADAYHDGARISANSWGAPASGDYDIDAQRYDALVRDAQPSGSTFPVASNQQMVIVFAAGNAGPGASTLDSPGSAKNVITVGASENVRSLSLANGGNNGSGNDGCTTPDSEADSANDLTTFSSRGPCADSRKKPDLVAPGTHITGGVGQSGSATTNGTGVALACFSAGGVCALPGAGSTGNANDFFPLGQQFYTVSTGTSHSTPAVAGACALLRQYFINNSLTPPSPAMTKACLLNSTRYLTGSGANDTLWSNGQGMGELNLGMAFDGVPRILRDQISADKFTGTGQTRTFTGTITDPAKPFRVTLAWTDAPGPTSGNAFKNDLDLIVTVGGVTYKGNVFSGALSITGGVADNRNNVESVFLPAGLTGSFIVTVSAANINSDGVPNEAPSLDQDFALVVYNAVQQPLPVLTLVSAALASENCFPTNGAIDPGETVTASFALKNIGTADTTNLVVTLLQTNGVLFPNGPVAYGALVAGGGAVTQAFTFTAIGSCGGTIAPALQMQDDSLNLGLANTTFALGAQTLITQSMTNSANIKVPASGTSGKASPYPSTISVSGITGLVSKVTVTLVGVSHTFPDDIDALLVGPNGQTLMVMSDCGGSSDISGVTLTFDDAAVAMLPDASAITAGTYKPSNYDTATDNLPSPAPSGPFGTTLSVFNGLDPNGTWSLYVQDDANGDMGNITGGWRLSITTSNTICCAGSVSSADVAIGETASPPATNVGGQITFILNVTNLGPNTASSVTVTDTLPAGLLFVSANVSQGTFTNVGNAVTCDLGTLANGATALVTLQTTTITNGVRTNTAGVSSALFDSAGANNTAAAMVAINAFPTLSTFTNQTTAEGTPIGPIAFTIGDAETPPAALSLSAASSDTNLVAVANIVFGGSSSNRTVTISPSTNRNGACTISISVSDGQAAATNSFLLTVTPVNDPPVLSPIANRTIHVGFTLVITNSATDIDVPTNTLTFSLGTNAPAGAVIGGASGIFSWTPDNAFANTTNDITVEVTDDGLPPLSDSKSFTVAVEPPPFILSITEANGLVTLTWSAIDGQKYLVQYKDNLFDPDWTDLSPEVTASGPTASKTESISESTQRFYRIVVP